MNDLERVNDSINRVTKSVSSVGKDDPTSLKTKEGFVYRETGMPQIIDIINCGYVRYNVKRASRQVWWTYGGPNSFHVNKEKAVLVASCDCVIDCNEGAIFIDDLAEIWMYDKESMKWFDRIEDVRKLYIEKHLNDYNLGR